MAREHLETLLAQVQAKTGTGLPEYDVTGSYADNCASIALDFISRLIDAGSKTTFKP